MSEPRHVAGEEALALAGAARLFGDLLLVELDDARLEALGAPEPAALLGDLGVEVPEARGAVAVDELAAEYHAAFLRPDGGGAPPVRIVTLVDSAALPAQFYADENIGDRPDLSGHVSADSPARSRAVAQLLASQARALAGVSFDSADRR